MKPTDKKNGGALPGKYLTVVLAGETYGIAASKVREIIPLPPITSVPQMPDHVRGVCNLRGHVIPIIDLRLKFRLPAEVAERTCIVVVHVALPGNTLALGLIVDGVEEVANVTAPDIAPTPGFGVNVDTSYLLGMAQIKGRVTALLDLDRFIVADTLQTLLGLR